uniref:Uncharacterized protein n=1 Tax=Peronospora matthiolae TaxID=2874970 RepID=A0AAV1T1S4_9STRA
MIRCAFFRRLGTLAQESAFPEQQQTIPRYWRGFEGVFVPVPDAEAVRVSGADIML